MTIADEDVDWWRGAVIYQIYPRSFYDSDGNGIGDLRGIEAKLDAIAALGVDALWISPFFKSPMKDFGYDVSDFRDVDPIFGTLSDFEHLLRSAHARGLKVLIDLVLSHTSDAHPWFIESRSSRDNPRADWYVWADPTASGNAPNNWLSLFGGCAWEWDPRRAQYYFHNFLRSQPDLNFHHPAVREAVLDIARFWLELGVDGFRLDVVNFYFHDAQLRSNPPIGTAGQSHTVQPNNPYAYQDHLYDKQQPENLLFLEQFRQLLDRYPGTTTVGELGTDRDVPQATEQYTERGRRLHQVYGFQLMTPTLDASYVRSVVSAMEAGVKTGWVSWAVANHDFPRVISRWGFEDDPDRAAALIIALVGSLRGSPCIYQGEELGLSEAQLTREQIRDPYGLSFWPDFKGRDGCRTPYPWDEHQPHAGFSSHAPWLPIPEAHVRRAYGRQQHDPQSALWRVRRFLHWRRTQPALQRGSIEFLPAEAPLLALRRRLGDTQLVAVFNLGRSAATFTPSDASLQALPGSGFEPPVAGSGYRLEPLNALFLGQRP